MEEQNSQGFSLPEGEASQVFEVEAEPITYVSYDGSYESIIRQVAEQIHVQISENSSSMEMQLNPENLGKLGLSVELRQGILTARFTAENEQVREAVESQAAVLREDLVRQGLKVEAIEVTVETHEFERNLEQGQQQSQAQEDAAREQNQKNARRNLNLDLLEEEEELTDAEDLAAKIMKENGNTMDYFA
jgi:flagellar hook-length control protein FliK